MPWIRNSYFYFTPASSENLKRKNSTLEDKTPVLTRLRSYLKSPPINGGSTTTDGNLGSTNSFARQFFASIRRVFKSEEPTSTNTFQVLSTSSKTSKAESEAKNRFSQESPSKEGAIQGKADQELTRAEKIIKEALKEVINNEKNYQKRLNVLIQLKEVLNNPKTKAKLEGYLKTPEERVFYASLMDYFSGNDLDIIKAESEKVLKKLNANAEKLNSNSRDDVIEAAKEIASNMTEFLSIKENLKKLSISYSIFEKHQSNFNDLTSTTFEFNKKLISKFDAILRDKEITYDGNNKDKTINVKMENLATLQMEPIQRVSRYFMPFEEILKRIKVEDSALRDHIQNSYKTIKEISECCNDGIKSAEESRYVLMDILKALYMANREGKNINVGADGKLILEENLDPKESKEKANLAMKTILSDLNKIVDSQEFISQEFINQTEVKNVLKMLENLKQMKKAVTVHRNEIQALKAKIDSF